MHISKKVLRNLIKEEINILLEEEGEEEEGEEEEAEEEELDLGEEEGDDASAEEEEKPEPTPAEEASLSKSADDQILSHIIDFETNAIKSATVQQDDQLRPDPEGPPIDIELESRWYKSDLSKMLFEEEETEGPSLDTAQWVGSPDIDIAVFAGDVARLIMNYDSLIDMEALILNKSQSYISDKYDPETSDYFIELMDVEHDMRTQDPAGLDQENEGPPSPTAIGGGFGIDGGGGV